MSWNVVYTKQAQKDARKIAAAGLKNKAKRLLDILRINRSQAQQGGWDFDLKSVYTIGILDFVFDEDKSSDQVYHHEVQLFDKSVQAVFYDKLTYIYLEMPKFTKTLDQLETHFDNWLYVLKNLEHLTDRPAQLRESVFTKLFEQAEIANIDDKEYNEYEESLKTYRDLKNSFDTAREEGREEGRREDRREGRREGGKEERITIAGKLKRQDVPPEIISRSTGLRIEEIEKL